MGSMLYIRWAVLRYLASFVFGVALACLLTLIINPILPTYLQFPIGFALGFACTYTMNFILIRWRFQR